MAASLWCGRCGVNVVIFTPPAGGVVQWTGRAGGYVDYHLPHVPHHVVCGASLRTRAVHYCLRGHNAALKTRFCAIRRWHNILRDQTFALFRLLASIGTFAHGHGARHSTHQRVSHRATRAMKLRSYRVLVRFNARVSRKHGGIDHKKCFGCFLHQRGSALFSQRRVSAAAPTRSHNNEHLQRCCSLQRLLQARGIFSARKPS